MLIIHELASDAGLRRYELSAERSGLIQLPKRDQVAAAGKKIFGEQFTLRSCWSTCVFVLPGEPAPQQLREFAEAIRQMATVLMISFKLQKKPGSG